jgi:hypothetical protein
MKDELVTYKTAKLAKKIGFKEACDYYYGKSFANNNNNNLYYSYDGSLRSKSDIECPTQSQLQNHLREKYNLHVIVTPEFYKTGINYCVQVLCYDPTQEDFTDNDKSTGLYGDNGEFPRPEKALEFGLQLALNLIK